jgi:hypothetical protein
VHKGLDYGRSHNPTRWALERCVADIESGARPSPSPPAWPPFRRAGTAAGRLAHRGRRRHVRRHLPPVRARAPPQRRPRIHLRRPDRPAGPGQRAAAGNEDGVGRDADQPDAEAGRPARHRRAVPRARHPQRVRQHLRQPDRAAPAGTRHRHRGALDHQVHERPLGRDRRGGGGRREARTRRCASASASSRTRSARSRARSTASWCCAGSRPWPCASNAARPTRWNWRSGWKASARSAACTTRAWPRTRSTSWRGARCTATAASSRSTSTPTWPARAASWSTAKSSPWPRAWAGSRA